MLSLRGIQILPSLLLSVFRAGDCGVASGGQPMAKGSTFRVSFPLRVL